MIDWDDIAARTRRHGDSAHIMTSSGRVMIERFLLISDFSPRLGWLRERLGYRVWLSRDGQPRSVESLAAVRVLVEGVVDAA
ncbi:MAG: hypothetical protein HQL66_00600 [Magnetococcales bacterium]|nr:hypothetical protein [Magnetococcales bacterium]